MHDSFSAAAARVAKSVFETIRLWWRTGPASGPRPASSTPATVSPRSHKRFSNILGSECRLAADFVALLTVCTGAEPLRSCLLELG